MRWPNAPAFATVTALGVVVVALALAACGSGTSGSSSQMGSVARPKRNFQASNGAHASDPTWTLFMKIENRTPYTLVLRPPITVGPKVDVSPDPKIPPHGSSSTRIEWSQSQVEHGPYGDGAPAVAIFDYYAPTVANSSFNCYLQAQGNRNYPDSWRASNGAQAARYAPAVEVSSANNGHDPRTDGGFVATTIVTPHSGAH